MPQLWTETIVSQYFWLVVILLGFYYLAAVRFIPQIAFTLKARRALEAAGEDSKSNSLQVGGQPKAKGVLQTPSEPKALLSAILAPKTATIPSGISTAGFEGSLRALILTTRANWISKAAKL